jgi:hypothetical protein
MIKMILDTATMRIIYFTANVDESLAIVDKTFQYDYAGDLPKGFSLNNCWDWRLDGNVIKHAPGNKESTKETLLQQNRKEAIKLLNERIGISRTPLIASCKGGESIRQLKLDNDLAFIESLAKAKGISAEEYKSTVETKRAEYLEKMKNSEINREYYLTKLKKATTNEEIIALRDSFANTNLLKLRGD